MVVDSGNTYAQLLKEQGNYVITVEGVDWYEYNRFMIPAYLPHCCPEITPEVAAEVVKISGRPFARWDSAFGQTQNSQWWYVIRKGTWSLDKCSGNTRSKIRRGRKNLFARILAPEEMLRVGYEVCTRAEKRYEKAGFVPSRQVHERKVQAATKVQGVLEFFGVFASDKLAGYSENYIQNNAVFWESIWYDPEYLPKYSSYVLVSEMLSHYLNERKLTYVLDGCRSIYHRTGVQDYLMGVFGFTKEYAILNIVYSPKFAMALKAAYPFRSVVWSLSSKWANITLDKVGAVLRQEYIRKTCENQSSCLNR
jgi:hypothetical protein